MLNDSSVARCPGPRILFVGGAIVTIAILLFRSMALAKVRTQIRVD